MICLYIGTNTGSCGLITAQKDPGKKKKTNIRSCISDGMKVDSVASENKKYYKGPELLKH